MRAVVLFTALALVAATTVATAKPTRKQRREARTHYKAGAKAFDAGNYELAIVGFEAAYEIDPSPALLFNIALAYERALKLPEALERYQEYLADDPDGPAAEEARQSIATIEEKLAAEEEERERKELEAQRAAEEAAARAAREEREALARQAPPPPPERPKWRTISGWSSIGVGAVLAGLSLRYTMDQRRRADRLAEWTGPWPEDLKSRVDAANRARDRALIFGGAATLTAIGGVALLLWPTRAAEKRPASLQVQVIDSAGAISWQTEF